MDNEINDLKKFVKAGKAIFTLTNTETGNRMTYKVNKHKEKDLWFVSVLNGPDNYSNYNYIGTVFGNDFRHTQKSRVGKDSMSFKAFAWLNAFMNSDKNIPDHVHVYHEGRCGRCGKRLTVPESILAGFGPECVRLVRR